MNLLEKDRSIRDLDRSKQKIGEELDFAAREAYNALIDDQKNLISEEIVAKLEEAEEAVAVIDASYPISLEECTHNLIEISSVTKSNNACYWPKR